MGSWIGFLVFHVSCVERQIYAKKEQAEACSQLVEKVFSTSCLRFQNFQKVLKSIDWNGAGHPSWVPRARAGLRPVALRNVLRASRAHPSFPFSYISGFFDSLACSFLIPLLQRTPRSGPAGRRSPRRPPWGIRTARRTSGFRRDKSGPPASPGPSRPCRPGHPAYPR